MPHSFKNHFLSSKLNIHNKILFIIANHFAKTRENICHTEAFSEATTLIPKSKRHCYCGSSYGNNCNAMSADLLHVF